MLNWYLKKRRVAKKRSASFCILPWIHLHALPSGHVLPCCVSPYEDSYGELAASNMRDIWNNERFKKLRLNMLNGKKSKSCARCYQVEHHGGVSLRHQMNEVFAEDIDVIMKTRRDGALADFKMIYLDMRFSNICNLKCLGCSPTLSTSWFDDYEKLYGKKHSDQKLQRINDVSKDFWQDLEKVLPTIKRAYFAGGEPLLMPEHYRCLDVFLASGNTDLMLTYNTNFMVLDSREGKILDYWKKFSQVVVSVSIDDIGPRGEYFRFGSHWDTLVKNLQTLQRECPHVKIDVTCTVSMFNIFRLPEIHHYLLEKNFIGSDGFFLNYLLDPSYLCSTNLSDAFKEQVEKKLNNYIHELKLKHSHRDWRALEDGFAKQIAYMNSRRGNSEDRDSDEWLSRIDLVRGQSYRDTYPELDGALQ